MPLSGQYSWKQSDGAVEIAIPLKGVKASSISVDITDSYLKVNYAPYLIFIDLHDFVNDREASATTAGGTLTVTLQKRSEAVWPDLELVASKPELRARRADSDARKAVDDAKAAAHVKEGKREREQLAFKKQMQLEEARRRRLDDEKAAVKAEATADVFTTLSPLQQEDAARRVRGVLGVSDGGGEEEEEEVHFIPAPRRAQGDGILKVGFSDRPFPTPLRESRHKEESTWLAKHKEQIATHAARKREEGGQGANALPARDVSERDADWLKERGDTFYAGKDFLGAINAYTAALLQRPGFVPALSNRAACHLRRGVPLPALDDCCSALALLPALWGDAPPATVPPTLWEGVLAAREDVSAVGAVAHQHRQSLPATCPAPASSPALPAGEYATFRSLVRVLTRRAAALCQAGEFSPAQADLVAAEAVAVAAASLPGAPADPPISMDVGALQEDGEFMGCLVQADSAKGEGDAAARAGEWGAATAAYKQAVEGSEGLLLKAHLNLSVALAASGDLPGAVHACTDVVHALLEEEEVGALTPVPPKNSVAGRELKGQALARRGLLLAKLGLWDDALPDLRSAASIFPKDAQLKTDMQLAATKVAVTETTMPVPGGMARV